MRRAFAILALLAVAPLAAHAAAPATPSGTSSEGARFTLVGQVVTIVLPKPVRHREVVSAVCGRAGLRGTSSGKGRTRGRRLRTVRIRLRGDTSAAEWCRYTHVRDHFGAAQLTPGAPPVERLQPGPGVREADGWGYDEPRHDDARVLARGSVVTVELPRPFATSRIADIVCGRGETLVGHRAFAVHAGQRVVTADVEGDVSEADWCLVEENGGRDVAGAQFD